MKIILNSSLCYTTTHQTEANLARNLWGATFRGKVLSIDAPDAKGYGKLRSRKFSAIEQEQALLGSDGIYVSQLVIHNNGNSVTYICTCHVYVFVYTYAQLHYTVYCILITYTLGAQRYGSLSDSRSTVKRFQQSKANLREIDRFYSYYLIKRPLICP